MKPAGERGWGSAGATVRSKPPALPAAVLWGGMASEEDEEEGAEDASQGGPGWRWTQGPGTHC